MISSLLRNATIGVVVGLLIHALVYALARVNTDQADTVAVFLFTLNEATGANDSRVVVIHLVESAVFYALCASVGAGVGLLCRVSLSSARKNHTETGA